MTEGHPREPMYLYLEAVGVALFGTTANAIRGVSVFVGVLTIPAVWALAREMRGPYLAAVAAVAFAFLRWHVMFSTLAFRTILAPLFAGLTALFFLRTIRTRNLSDAVICGALLGLGAYTYLAFRLMPLILIPPAIVAFIADRRTRETYGDDGGLPGLVSRFAAVVGVAFIVFLPLGFNYIQHPEHFSGRSGEVSLSDHDNTFSLLMKQARDVALMPLVRGDHVGKHNLPGPPQFIQSTGINPEEVAAAWEDEQQASRLDGRAQYDPHGTGVPVVNWLIGILFYTGLTIVVIRARNHPTDALVVAWLGIGSLASVLSFGAPNMLRLLMIAPAFVLCLAVGFLFVTEKAAEAADAVGVMLAILILMVFFWTELRQLYIWPTHPMVPREFNTEFADLGEFLYEQPDRLNVRIASEFGMPPTLEFLADGYQFNLPKSEIGERWWEFQTAPPFPPLTPRSQEVEGGRKLTITHPAGIEMGRVVEVE